MQRSLRMASISFLLDLRSSIGRVHYLMRHILLAVALFKSPGRDSASIIIFTDSIGTEKDQGTSMDAINRNIPYTGRWPLAASSTLYASRTPHLLNKQSTHVSARVWPQKLPSRTSRCPTPPFPSPIFTCNCRGEEYSQIVIGSPLSFPRGWPDLT
jgi:hypothetical protein